MTRLLHWLSGCVHAAATTSARDDVYADRRCLVAWRWLA
jgi:hypothetical protein